MRQTLFIAIGILFTQQGCVQQKGMNEPKGNYPPMLEEAYKEARKASNLRSFLISQNNEIIAEEYFDRYSSDSLDHIRSGTKSVMSTLIGIAIDRGIIAGVDESIKTYLPNLSKEKEDITIKHLLTMTSGIKWNEGANAEGYSAWARSPNELKYVLNKPMAATPGAVWNYNSGATHILSAILAEASGMNTLKFAEKYLFEPLGIDHVRWEKNADGYYNGGAGLELRPRDMIKLGQLYANEGVYGGRRIISKNYVKAATSHQQPPDMELGENAGYGYCWWLGGDDGIHVYAALGYGGQIIAVVRDTDIVLVITHNWRGINGTIAAEQDQTGINVVAATAVKALLEE